MGPIHLGGSVGVINRYTWHDGFYYVDAMVVRGGPWPHHPSPPCKTSETLPIFLLRVVNTVVLWSLGVPVWKVLAHLPRDNPSVVPPLCHHKLNHERGNRSCYGQHLPLWGGLIGFLFAEGGAVSRLCLSTSATN